MITHENISNFWTDIPEGATVVDRFAGRVPPLGHVARVVVDRFADHVPACDLALGHEFARVVVDRFADHVPAGEFARVVERLSDRIPAGHVARVVADRLSDRVPAGHVPSKKQKRKVSLWLVVLALVVGVLRNQLLPRRQLRMRGTIVTARPKSRVPAGHVAQGTRVPAGHVARVVVDRVPAGLKVSLSHTAWWQTDCQTARVPIPIASAIG